MITHDPFVYTDSISKEFLEKIRDINVNTTVEQFEGYAIQGIKALALPRNYEKRRVDKKAELREVIRKGLRK